MTTETSGHITAVEQKPGMPTVNINDTWHLQYNNEQQRGTIGAINTEQVGDGPIKKREIFRPFQNKEDIQPWIDNMRDKYFGHRVQALNQQVPIERFAYDDTKENALVGKLEHMLNRPSPDNKVIDKLEHLLENQQPINKPKVLVIKPYHSRSSHTPKKHHSSTVKRRSHAKKKNHSPKKKKHSPKKKTHSPKKKHNYSPKRRVPTSPKHNKIGEFSLKEAMNEILGNKT